METRLPNSIYLVAITDCFGDAAYAGGNTRVIKIKTDKYIRNMIIRIRDNQDVLDSAENQYITGEFA